MAFQRLKNICLVLADAFGNPQPENPEPAKVETKLEPLPQKITISCVVQKILDDLAIENYESWHIESKQSSMGIINSITYLLKKRKEPSYTLNYYNSYGYCSVELDGINSLAFTDGEKNLLIEKIHALQSHIDKVASEKRKQKDEKKLAKIFPSCYPKDNGINIKV